MERCPECGFDPITIDPATAADSIRGFARKWQAPLTRFLPGEDGAAIVRTRPDPSTWSPVEYGAHVRDVFALFTRRVEQILSTDAPTQLETLDHESAVRAGHYNELDPTAVAGSIGNDADGLATTLEKLDATDWTRAGLKNGEPRTILEIAQRAVHEGTHHLLDAGRGLRAARGR